MRFRGFRTKFSSPGVLLSVAHSWGRALDSENNECPEAQDPRLAQGESKPQSSRPARSLDIESKDRDTAVRQSFRTPNAKHSTQSPYITQPCTKILFSPTLPERTPDCHFACGRFDCQKRVLSTERSDR